MTLLLVALVLAQTAEEAPPPASPEAETPREKIEEGSAQVKEGVQEAVTGKPVEEPPKPSPWTANLTAGLTWVTGNVISFSMVGAASATRKDEKTIFNAKLFGAYGEKYGPLPQEVLIYNAGATAQFDYRFNPTFSAFLGAGLDMDHVKSIELRYYGDLGIGATWLDTKQGEPGKEIQKALIKTDLSLRVQPEQRFQYYPTLANVEDALIFGPRLAAQGHYAWSANTYFHEEVEFLPNVIGKARFLINSSTKLAVGVVSILSLSATFTVKGDTAPAEGKRPVDTIFTVGAEANF